MIGTPRGAISESRSGTPTVLLTVVGAIFSLFGLFFVFGVFLPGRARGEEMPIVVLLFGIVFAAIGPLVFWLSRRRSTARRRHHDLGQPKASTSTEAMREAAAPIGRVQLESSARRWGIAGFLLVFALIWNGVVWTLLGKGMFDEAAGGRDLFRAVFWLFPLAGIAVLLAAIYHVLACVNLAPALTLTEGKLIPGSRTDLEWALHATRETDQLIGLRDRVTRGEDLDGDVFVSVHVNGCRDRGARGAEVFFLSLRGASDAATRELASLENSAVPSEDPMLREIADLPFAVDLIQTDTIQRSSLLSEAVLATLGDSGLAAARGVKQANFAVLRSCRMPSTLIELGFISNPGDAKQLAKASHRQALAETIANGLLEFRRQYARGTGTGEHVSERR